MFPPSVILKFPWKILKIHTQRLRVFKKKEISQFTGIISVCSLAECLSSVCGFPLSQYLRDQSWFCGRNARMSACLVSLNNTRKNVHRRFFTTQTCNPWTVTGFVRDGSVCNKSICNEVNQVVLMSVRKVFSNTVFFPPRNT